METHHLSVFLFCIQILLSGHLSLFSNQTTSWNVSRNNRSLLWRTEWEENGVFRVITYASTWCFVMASWSLLRLQKPPFLRIWSISTSSRTTIERRGFPLSIGIQRLKKVSTNGGLLGWRRRQMAGAALVSSAISRFFGVQWSTL